MMFTAKEVLPLLRDALALIDHSEPYSLRWVAGRALNDDQLLVIWDLASSEDRWATVVSLSETASIYSAPISRDMLVSLIVDYLMEPTKSELRPEIDLADGLVESPRSIRWRDAPLSADSKVQTDAPTNSAIPWSIPGTIQYGASWTPRDAKR